MRKVFLWLGVALASLVFLVASALQYHPWNSEPEAHDTASETEASSGAVPLPADDGTRIRSGDASPAGKQYFPEDTLQLLYEYSMVDNGALNKLQKGLTMTLRVDGVRTINGKRYFKEVTDYTGQEDLLEFLKKPPADAEEERILRSREITDFRNLLETSFSPSITYSRWDRTGQYDLDGDLGQPEYPDPPFPVGVGTEWSEHGARLKAVSVEDVQVGDQTYNNCLKIRASGGAASANMQGTIVYNAPGIGIVKMTLPDNSSWILRKYRR